MANDKWAYLFAPDGLRLRGADEVDPMFAVWTGDVTGTASLPMQHTSVPSTKAGTRVDVTIEDIIRENGVRSSEADI